MDKRSPPQPISMTDLRQDTYNIHWVIDEPLYGEVTSLNRVLVDRCGSEIDFSRGHRPHITLLMGSLLNSDSLSTALGRLSVLAQLLAPIQFVLGAPYLESCTHRYVFMDPVDPLPFVRAKASAALVMSGLFRLPSVGGPGNPPHISLAYITRECPFVDGVPSERTGQISTVRRIGVARCGPHGTCIDQLLIADV